MKKITGTLLFWILILCACSSSIPSTETVTQNAPPTTQPPTLVSIATTQAPPATTAPPIDQPSDVATTAAPSNPQDCGYQWANQNLPELSANFLQSMQTLQTGVQAVAFGFGENCVHTDGTATFIPMETDFNVTLQVNDLSDEAA